MAYRDRGRALEYWREYYLAHKEKRSKQDKERRRANPELFRERDRKRSLERRRYHLEEERQRYREYYRRNRTRILERQRQYVKDHPDEYHARVVARARIQTAAYCELCGKPATLKHHPDYSDPLHVEHLCAKCHRSRHNKAEVKK